MIKPLLSSVIAKYRVCICFPDQLFISASADDWSARHWQIMIFCSTSSNNCWILIQHLTKFSYQIFAPQKRIIAFLELLSFFNIFEGLFICNEISQPFLLLTAKSKKAFRGVWPQNYIHFFKCLLHKWSYDYLDSSHVLKHIDQLQQSMKNPCKSLHFSTVVVIFAIYVDNDAGWWELYLPNDTSNRT